MKIASVYGFLFTLGLVHTTLEKFENSVFTPKTYEMFFVLITPEKLAGRRNKHRSFSVCVWRKLGIGNDIVFENPFKNIFRPH